MAVKGLISPSLNLHPLSLVLLLAMANHCAHTWQTHVQEMSQFLYGAACGGTLEWDRFLSSMKEPLWRCIYRGPGQTPHILMQHVGLLLLGYAVPVHVDMDSWADMTGRIALVLLQWKLQGVWSLHMHILCNLYKKSCYVRTPFKAFHYIQQPPFHLCQWEMDPKVCASSLTLKYMLHTKISLTFLNMIHH